MSNYVYNCLEDFLAYDLSNFLKNNEIYYTFSNGCSSYQL